MSKRKTYSQRTKRAALVALERNGGNLYQTAKQMGISAPALSHWRKAAEERGELPLTSSPLPPLEDDNSALDDQLEQLARQMVAVMPEKVEEATLQELVRSLAIVLNTMNQARSGKEESGDVYEKLARLMDRYAPKRPADGDLPPPEES